MWRLNSLIVSFFSLFGAAGIALADATVDQQPLGPDGQLFGGSRSPKGNHLAIFAAKGSHYQIIMDGVAGPKIDNLIFNIAGDQYRAGDMWGNMPIPVIFSKDGAHWAYMAKQGDEYVVMLDGKELARGPINTRNLGSSLNLTFSANGQHLFWSDDDAQGNYVIVVDGKPGPATRTLPQLVLSPDGTHYAYVNYNRDGTGAWAFVDGRQVNYFGDIVQYTAKNILVSTMHTPDNNNILLLNGKPEIKANSFRQMTISPDGKQMAMIITPQPNAPSFLTVNGKQVPFAKPGEHGGWSFEGNTLTTIVPVPAQSTAAKVVVEVRRGKGVTAVRADLDGFAGKMIFVRCAYDAMQATGPVAGPSLALIDAMQSGDRLSYFPEKIDGELAHFRQALEQAQADLAALDKEFEKRLSDTSRRIGGATLAPADVESEKQKRRDALHRAEALLAEAAK